VPGDVDAEALLREASAHLQIRDAEYQVKKGNYASASNELASVMMILPDDAGAQEVRAELNKGEQDLADTEQRVRLAQVEKERRERLAVPEKAFQVAMQSIRNHGQLFPEHKVTANMPASEVESALLTTFTNDYPRFVVDRPSMPYPNSFGFVASRRVLGGLRQCVVAGAQTGDQETKLIFRVIEYRLLMNFSMPTLLSVKEDDSVIVLDSNFQGQLTEEEKLRIQEAGPEMLKRILKAIGHGP
jgi:hypothetical protein